jgi:hypothetical protein
MQSGRFTTQTVRSSSRMWRFAILCIVVLVLAGGVASAEAKPQPQKLWQNYPLDPHSDHASAPASSSAARHLSSTPRVAAAPPASPPANGILIEIVGLALVALLGSGAVLLRLSHRGSLAIAGPITLPPRFRSRSANKHRLLVRIFDEDGDHRVEVTPGDDRAEAMSEGSHGSESPEGHGMHLEASKGRAGAGGSGGEASDPDAPDSGVAENTGDSPGVDTANASPPHASAEPVAEDGGASASESTGSSARSRGAKGEATPADQPRRAPDPKRALIGRSPDAVSGVPPLPAETLGPEPSEEPALRDFAAGQPRSTQASSVQSPEDRAEATGSQRQETPVPPPSTTSSEGQRKSAERTGEPRPPRRPADRKGAADRPATSNREPAEAPSDGPALRRAQSTAPAASEAMRRAASQAHVGAGAGPRTAARHAAAVEGPQQSGDTRTPLPNRGQRPAPSMRRPQRAVRSEADPPTSPPDRAEAATRFGPADRAQDPKDSAAVRPPSSEPGARSPQPAKPRHELIGTRRGPRSGASAGDPPSARPPEVRRADPATPATKQRTEAHPARRCAIVCHRSGSTARFHVVAVEGETRDGPPIVRSQPFAVSPAGAMTDDRRARAAHDALVARLRAVGWRDVDTEGEWFESEFIRDVDVDSCTVACLHVGREARFEAVQVDDYGNAIRLASSPAFSARRFGAVRPTSEARAMHDGLVRYLQRLGWTIDEASGEDWYSTVLKRARS